MEQKYYSIPFPVNQTAIKATLSKGNRAQTSCACTQQLHASSAVPPLTTEIMYESSAACHFSGPCNADVKRKEVEKQNRLNTA
mmetsp:Transcript_90971/g.157815  ORF Transcript_90971/g.157815 Transcript_90971/m.157815 type:complete len:83 (+) Transcript_90971:691-939(+)